MRFNRIFFVFIFLFILILFSGCNFVKKENCSILNTVYEKYSYNDSLKKCVLVKKIKKDVCGNHIPESGETFCNCPTDVSETDPNKGCYGGVGEYLFKKCNNKKECGLFPKEDLVYLSKNIENLGSGGVTFNVLLTFQNPIIINTEKNTNFKFKISLFKRYKSYNTNISDINVEEILLIDDSNIRYAYLTINKPIDEKNDIEGILKFEETPSFKKRVRLKLELIFNYKKHFFSGNKETVKEERSIVKYNLGYFTIINGKFSNEAKKEDSKNR